MDKLFKFIFGNPWVFCVLITMGTTIITWVGLDDPIRSKNKLLVGALFGFSVGMTHVCELCFNISSVQKRIFGAFVGLFFGLTMVFLLKLSPISYLIASIFGVFLGGTARDWTKHINFI